MIDPSPQPPSQGGQRSLRLQSPEGQIFCYIGACCKQCNAHVLYMKVIFSVLDWGAFRAFTRVGLHVRLWHISKGFVRLYTPAHSKEQLYTQELLGVAGLFYICLVIHPDRTIEDAKKRWYSAFESTVMVFSMTWPIAGQVLKPDQHCRRELQKQKQVLTWDPPPAPVVSEDSWVSVMFPFILSEMFSLKLLTGVKMSESPMCVQYFPFGFILCAVGNVFILQWRLWKGCCTAN